MSYHSILTMNSPAFKRRSLPLLTNMNACSITRIVTQSLPALSDLKRFGFVFENTNGGLSLAAMIAKSCLRPIFIDYFRECRYFSSKQIKCSQQGFSPLLSQGTFILFLTEQSPFCQNAFTRALGFRISLYNQHADT